MTTRANVNLRFFLRFVLIAVICIGFGLYCLYDGFVGYPNQTIRADKFKELDDENRLGEWAAIAKENGWSREYPGEAKTEADIATQFIMAGVCFPIGLFTLFLYLRSRGRWIEASDTGINSSWGQQLEFEQIVHIDKKKWNSKGIAKIRYTVEGHNKTFVVDDCKFHREPTETILRLVERNLSPEQFVNGGPEPPPEASGPDEESDEREAVVSQTVDP